MTLDKSSTRIQQMFGEIAERYDLLNRLLSCGIDRSWRRRTVKLAPPVGDAPILDVCTGTADLALAYWRAGRGKTPVVGTDFCAPMLEIGRRKVAQAVKSSVTVAQTARLRENVGQVGNLPSTAWEPEASASALAGCQPVPRIEPGVTLLEADTLHLPFPANTFQIVSVAFGLRNVADTDAGLREMVRVCQPGGRVVVLEFSTPTVWPLGALYGWYFRHVLPRIGQTLARNTQTAYNYLPQSVSRFPQGEALAQRLEAAGTTDVRIRRFTFGVATLYVGRKRPADA
ncbi:MAG: class I SAM-dependent methyltransferase [Planctomycetaceae bacterium]|nr:class I SAM-dependent methyltransferase [Planctomycetaceae bacterium]